MPVSARFEADFSQFVSSTKNADAALHDLETRGERTGTTIRSLGDAKVTTAGKIDKFNLSVGQADALLGRFGVNLPPQVRGLADLASSGVTAAGGLSLVGAAGLVAAAGFAGWKVGEWIGGVTGLTDAIAKGTAAARGWGDVTGQEAAAGADTLGRASKTAGRGITDMTEAIEINRVEAVRLIAANTKTGASFLQLAADTTQAKAIMASNWEKLRQAEHDFAVALDKDAADLTKRRIEIDRALLADAAAEAMRVNGTASEILKAQNHDVYLAKLADLKANRTDTEANRKAIADFEATANAHDLVNQQTLHTGRLKDAQDIAAMERRTYDEMVANSDQYTRGALERQLEKVRALEFAATAQGRAMADGQKGAKAAIEETNKGLAAQLTWLERMAVIAKTNAAPSSLDITASNLSTAITNTKFGPTGASGEQYIQQAHTLAAEGYSFQEILAILRGGAKYAPTGQGIRGYDTPASREHAAPIPIPLVGGGGGWGGWGGGSITFNITQNITGVIDAALARKLTDAMSTEVMDRLRLGRQLGS